MGEVWEAQDETLNRLVAVKVISLLAGAGRAGDEARARFLREAQITARLQQANIVTVHDLGQTGTGADAMPFLVMELVQGVGLDERLRQGAVSARDAAQWGAQICDALAHAHALGVMHRDIKPSNILVPHAGGGAKVLDFGIARAVAPDKSADRLTHTGYVVGTPAYMAPEQARGRPEPRSDLYALGCLLFELITSRLPFQAPDAVGYLSAHLTEEPPAPSTVRPGVGAAWDDLVLTLLSKDPDKRYASADAVAQALRPLGQSHHRTQTGLTTSSSSTMGTTSQSGPARDAPFTMSWTGTDPLETYGAQMRAPFDGRRQTAKVGIAATAAAVGFYLSLGLNYGAVSGEQFTGWAAVCLLSALMSFYSLGVLVHTAWDRRMRRLHTGHRGWTLEVGPHGITTTSSVGRREFGWDTIQRIEIGSIRSDAPYAHNGILLTPRGNSRPRRRDCPAGWPYRVPPMRDGGEPLVACVLGPLTSRQRTTLVQALARFGGKRWQKP
ncbi:serine/threonine-protein kinase [Streptomyces sp. BH097]|uniref:serine/threonine-protein kinase n=1 Tax=unclassified Streptomyces TaxID=2593676 RepID=UPI003BB4F57C